MNFTSKAPDKPGFYAHRYRPDGEIAVYEFTTSDSFRGPSSGEWCLLLPADSLATSIEEAWFEGYRQAVDRVVEKLDVTQMEQWEASNARKKLLE